VVAGNEELASYARRFNRNVTVIPTVIDPARYTPAAVPRAGHVTVGWIGTAGNLPLLEPLRPVLARLGHERGVRVKIVSSEPPDWPEVPLEFERWTLGRSVDAIRELDVGLMPLTDTPWNRGKCGFKSIEYMALTIPPVGSPVGMLSSLIDHGRNGLLATDQDAWRRCLDDLIDSVEKRTRMGIQARETVRERYSVESAVPTLVSFLQRVIQGAS